MAGSRHHIIFLQTMPIEYSKRMLRVSPVALLRYDNPTFRAPEAHSIPSKTKVLYDDDDDDDDDSFVDSSTTPVKRTVLIASYQNPYKTLGKYYMIPTT